MNCDYKQKKKWQRQHGFIHSNVVLCSESKILTSMRISNGALAVATYFENESKSQLSKLEQPNSSQVQNFHEKVDCDIISMCWCICMYVCLCPCYRNLGALLTISKAWKWKFRSSERQTRKKFLINQSNIHTHTYTVAHAYKYSAAHTQITSKLLMRARQTKSYIYNLKTNCLRRLSWDACRIKLRRVEASWDELRRVKWNMNITKRCEIYWKEMMKWNVSQRTA